jgi:hypothetical protein
MQRHGSSRIWLCPLLLNATGISNDSLGPMLPESIESSLKGGCTLRAEIDHRGIRGTGFGHIKHLRITPSEKGLFVSLDPTVIAGHNYSTAHVDLPFQPFRISLCSSLTYSRQGRKLQRTSTEIEPSWKTGIQLGWHFRMAGL